MHATFVPSLTEVQARAAGAPPLPVLLLGLGQALVQRISGQADRDL